MAKSLIAAPLVAIATVVAIVVVLKRAPSYVNLAPQSARMYDPSPATRKAAVIEIYSKGMPEGTRTLLCAAREEDPEVLGTLANAIETTRDEKSIEWMTTQGIAFPERWTRYYSVKLLWKQQQAAAIPTLLPLLPNNYWQVQVAILDAIETSGQAAAGVEALAAVSAPGMNWKVRSRAVKLLGQANNVAAARALLEKALPAAGQIDGVAEKAVEDALGSMQDPEALRVVAEGLGSPDPARKLLAVKVLGLAKSAEQAGKLKEIAQDASGPMPLRVSALRAVLEAGGEDGEAFAVKALDGGDAAFRLEVASALSERKELSPATKADLKARSEKETDWRVKQALQIASGDRS